MNIGDKIPTMLGIDQNGHTVTEEQFAAKPLIIYFYPKDNTPGCTAETCSLQNGYDKLKELGYEIIGISKDSVASHIKFAAKYGLDFILLSDPDTSVNQSFGVWAKKKMAGREYMGTLRTTFVTDADHNITHIVTKVDTKNAADQLLDLLKQH